MDETKLLSFHARVVKDINEQLVLKLIQEHEIISSSDLVKITGMRPSTIFNILKELSAKSFVSFYGKGESTKKGGKKPYIWTLNKDAAYTIGLDIEVGEITSVVLDFSGGIIAKKNIKLDTGRTVDELAENITKVVYDTIAQNNIDNDRILGVGIAFAGIVDSQSGIVVMSSILPEMNFPLLEKLSDLPFHVLIENNANAAALGLKWNGNDKSKTNYLTILVEIDKNVSGLGIGIVINDELYRGASYSAGELYPHLPTLKELLSSVRSRFVESDILVNYSSSLESIDVEFLLETAKKGDKIARLIFSMIGNVVGQTIAPAVALLNPDTLIITGVVSELEDVIVDSVRKEIEMRVISITSNSLNIIADKYHHYSVAVGAASSILEDFFGLPISRLQKSNPFLPPVEPTI
ncbi:MAG: ROK family transcriptional regulator [Ignavibacteriaceae bacterium]|nr:ROK family transcriptional regulator [Ignavibacteriaceae bacterium]